MNKPASFPRRDQIWETTDGCNALVQYFFTAAITFSGTGSLTAKERVRIVNEDTDPPPTVVKFLPVRYDELHDRLVPPDVRATPRYKAYLLSVSLEYFQEHFRLIQASAS